MPSGRIRERFANTPYVPDNGQKGMTPRCANSRGRGRTNQEFDMSSIARTARPVSIPQAGVI